MKIKTVLFLLYATSLGHFHDTRASLQTPHKTKKRHGFSAPKQHVTLPESVPTFEFIQPSHPSVIPPELNFNTEKGIQSVSLFLPTVQFTADGVSTFFNQTFNREEYGTEFLPHSFSHMVQFLRYAYNTHQPLEFSEGVIRLFNQKLKSSVYVSAPAFERFLTQAPSIMEHQFAQKPYDLWHEFKSTLWSTFKKNFTFLQRHPDGFFEELSKHLERQVEKSVITPERARATFTRFCLSGLDKVIWCPQDQEETWYCFKKLGNLIQALHAKKIVPDELDMNDMYWSLVERYCFFLQLSGPQLSLKTCALIKEDLANQAVPWLLHKEQEAHIPTKTERLVTALLKTEARIRLNPKEFGRQNTTT